MSQSKLSKIYVCLYVLRVWMGETY